MGESLNDTTTNTETKLQNQITNVPGSSDFLRFILDKRGDLVISPTRKKGKMFTYSPIRVEQEFGISPKNQRAILRILKNNFRCLGYEFIPYADDISGLKANWAWYKELVDNHQVSHDDALKRVHYKEARVSLRENYEDVYDDIFALDKVVYNVHLEDIISPNGNNSVMLYFGDYPISKMNDGSQTCKVAERLFGEQHQNGENVEIGNISNPSDVLSRIVDKILEVKGLVFSDLQGNSVRVYTKITNRMLMEHGLSKEYLDDITLHHIKK